MNNEPEFIVLNERTKTDTNLAYRAIVVHDYVLYDGQVVEIKSFVPCTRYETVEDFTDFRRLLNEQLDYYRSQGWTPRKVYIESGGNPRFMYTL